MAFRSKNVELGVSVTYSRDSKKWNLARTDYYGAQWEVKLGERAGGRQTIIFFEFKYEFRLDLLDNWRLDIFVSREWHGKTSIWEDYFGCHTHDRWKSLGLGR